MERERGGECGSEKERERDAERAREIEGGRWEGMSMCGSKREGQNEQEREGMR